MAGSNQINVNTAIAIDHVTTDDATLGVFWAGSIPYYTGRVAIDFLGKSDRYIARLRPDLSGNVASNGMTSVPGHNKYNLDYSIKVLQPTYIQGFKYGGQDLSDWGKSKYATLEYKGITLHLLKESKSVLWNDISEPN